MGAFVLFKKSSNYIDRKGIENTFYKKGFKANPEKVNLKSHILWYYPKMKLGEVNLIKQGPKVLMGTGTFIYNQKWGLSALYDIINSISRDEFDVSRVKGDFLLLFGNNDGSIHFYPSPSYTYNIFYDKNETIFSSSFLAVLNGKNHRYSLNKAAISELLLTGNLVGPDTIINDIHRLENNSTLNNNYIHHHKRSSNAKREYEYGKTINDLNKAVDYQLSVLRNYFSRVTPFFKEKGVGVGLTGGLDSRLLLGEMISHNIEPMIYSTWRKTHTDEFSNAKKLTKALGTELHYIRHKTWNKMTQESFLELLNNNFWYNDGLIRTHQLWSEEIKSKEYLYTLLGKNQINTSGVGGEQYRNNERLKVDKYYDFRKWLHYEVLLKHNDNPFPQKKETEKILDYVQEKIKTKLDLKSDHKIHYLDIKRYYNEIYNPANRTIRNNIENQSHYFLSPFTDFKVSQKAYSAIPWLGLDFDFEKKMINFLNPVLANIQTDYGFSPNEKIKYKERLLTYTKRSLSYKLLWALYRKNKPKSQLISNMNEKFPLIKNYIKTVEELNLPIDISIIMNSGFLSPLVLELGFFIKKFDNKLL
jgi:hypothetical protein